jgi:hypothetical protein
MLSCKEVSILLSKARDTRLPVHQRLAVRLHLLYCRGCAQFRKQLAFLHRLARHPDVIAIGETRLPEPARQRIRQHLRREHP